MDLYETYRIPLSGPKPRVVRMGTLLLSKAPFLEK